MSKPLITQTLVKGELDMNEFIRQHQKPECTGQIIQLYKFQLNQKDPNIKYLTVCFRFYNDEQKAYYYHSADRVLFTNQLCSSCKLPDEKKEKIPNQAQPPEKPPKFVLLRFHAMSREDIASGDYVMPSIEGLNEEAAQSLQGKYNKNIDDFVISNTLLVNFHRVLEAEWQAFNERLKLVTKDPISGVVSGGFLSTTCPVGTTILDKVESTNKITGASEIKIIDPPRFTWKIPVFTPHSKSSNRAKMFAGRLGQVFMSNDEFTPAILDMELSKKHQQSGKKGLIEAQLLGVKNGVPHKETLTFMNVSNYITRKSRMSGYINLSNTIVTPKGHYYRILAPHCIVKPHKTVESNKDLSEEHLKTTYDADEAFAEIEDRVHNFDQVESDFKGMNISGAMPKTPAEVHADTLELSKIPLNGYTQPNSYGQLPQHPNSYGQHPQQVNPYGQQVYQTQAPNLGHNQQLMNELMSAKP